MNPSLSVKSCVLYEPKIKQWTTNISFIAKSDTYVDIFHAIKNMQIHHMASENEVPVDVLIPEAEHQTGIKHNDKVEKLAVTIAPAKQLGCINK